MSAYKTSERFHVTDNIRLYRRKVPLEDDKLEVTPEVVNTSLCVFLPLLIGGCLLRVYTCRFDCLSEIEYLGALIDSSIYTILHIKPVLDHAQ